MTIRTFLLAAFTTLWAGNAQAQQAQCGPTEAVLAELVSRYGETKYAEGLTTAGTIMILHGNKDTGTWTATITRPEGLTCLVSSGQGFQVLDEPLPPLGEDG